MKKTYYYKDPLNDDFSGTSIKKRPLPKNHKYIRKNPIRKFFSFVLYRLIATPVGSLFNFLVYGMKIVGKKKLKRYFKSGYFLYGNHVLLVGDAFTPTMVAFPKKAHVVVNSDATSIPVVGKIVEAIGGVPLPDDMQNMREFYNAVGEYARGGKVVVIYPEAHVWPYYTDVRPFKSTSFKYPAKYLKPVFCFTSVFTASKITGRLKTTVYVDGPFLPDRNLSNKENQENLRNQTYEAMKKRCEASVYKKCEYIDLRKSENVYDEKTDLN